MWNAPPKLLAGGAFGAAEIVGALERGFFSFGSFRLLFAFFPFARNSIIGQLEACCEFIYFLRFLFVAFFVCMPGVLRDRETVFNCSGHPLCLKIS